MKVDKTPNMSLEKWLFWEKIKKSEINFIIWNNVFSLKRLRDMWLKMSRQLPKVTVDREKASAFWDVFAISTSIFEQCHWAISPGGNTEFGGEHVADALGTEASEWFSLCREISPGIFPIAPHFRCQMVLKGSPYHMACRIHVFNSSERTSLISLTSVICSVLWFGCEIYFKR